VIKRARSLANLLLCLASGCASAPPPDGAAAAPEGPGQPVTPVATAAATAQPTAGGPTAKVTEVSGSAESTAYMKVTSIFTNPTSKPCRISRYMLVWPGGTKQIQLDDFSVPPGESRQRSVRVHPEDGDLKKLTSESARIEVGASC
jgi:hypothetical protein